MKCIISSESKLTRKNPLSFQILLICQYHSIFRTMFNTAKPAWLSFHSSLHSKQDMNFNPHLNPSFCTSPCYVICSGHLVLTGNTLHHRYTEPLCISADSKGYLVLSNEMRGADKKGMRMGRMYSTKWLVTSSEHVFAAVMFNRCRVIIVTTWGSMDLWKIKVSGWRWLAGIVTGAFKTGSKPLLW